MGQAGITIQHYFYKTTVYLILSFVFLLLFFTTFSSSLKCNAVEDSTFLITTTTPSPIHILPRDPFTTLADPDTTTPTPTGETGGDQDGDNNDGDEENDDSAGDSSTTPSPSPSPTTTLLTIKPSPSPPPPHEPTTNSTGPFYSVDLNCGYGTFCDKIYIAAIDAVKELVNVLDIENNNIRYSKL